MNKVIPSYKMNKNNQVIIDRNSSKKNLENNIMNKDFFGEREHKSNNIIKEKFQTEKSLKEETMIVNDTRVNTKKDINIKEKIEHNMNNLQLIDLLHKKEDDHITLVNKNHKLRSLVVQASQKLNELSEKMNTNEQLFVKEKETILKELDRITQNYQKYAHSYKNYSELEEKYQKLENDYEHNYNVLISYQDSISVFIKDYMNLYNLIFKFTSSKYERNPVNFLIDIRELILENLRKYQNTIDAMNFQSIYDEFINLIKPQESSVIQQENNILNNYINRPLYDNSNQESENNSPKNQRPSNKMVSPNVKVILPKEKIIQNKRNARYHSPDISDKKLSRSKSKEPPKQKLHKRNNSIDEVVENKKKNIENMESRIKQFFDQSNVQQELHGLNNNNLNFGENIHYTLSKNNSNSSKMIGNKNDLISERNKYNHAGIAGLKETEVEINPQFKSFPDKKGFLGTVIKDCYGNQKGDFNLKKGDRVEILSFNHNLGNYIVSMNEKRGIINANNLLPDVN